MPLLLLLIFIKKYIVITTEMLSNLRLYHIYHFELNLEHTKFLEKVLLIQIFKNWIFLFNITYIFQDI